MDPITQTGFALLLIAVAILFIWQPWKKEKLDLITREETEDLVKAPAHLDTTVNETVNEIVKPKRAAKRKAPVADEVDMCEVGEVDVAVIQKPARKKKVTI